jgi:hypothetical protein
MAKSALTRKAKAGWLVGAVLNFIAFTGGCVKRAALNYSGSLSQQNANQTKGFGYEQQ